MPNPERYRVTFYFHNNDGQLRTKEREVEAVSMNDALEKLKRIFGKISVIKIESIK
jgi:hypothetical protein